VKISKPNQQFSRSNSYLCSLKITKKSPEVTRTTIIATPGKHVKLLNPPTLFDSAPSFSHVATFSTPARMVYCAGQVKADVNGKAAEGLEAQVRLAFQNLKECLAAADASLRILSRSHSTSSGGTRI
jgi:enamine deaminase RidA (YjgF/YER057c/UK114 family)